ncbi:STAS domain-containing protein [Actinomycetospora soli]|uniref:STAS domain-containing protein n=1 Tax=Actinomycetospora soli TaxID=2893887 RepID=UPI001E404897|nr:STAS domain-containing protein [Actinomycetospora soli]MCD2185852.1 STAS domain-containing protein [Actinomycetospora soli]
MVMEPAAPPPGRRARSGGADGLASTVVDHPTGTVVRLAGGLRAATACVLREAVEGALDDGSAAVVLDLTDVVAEDDLGLWAIPAVAGDAHARGVAFTVVAPKRSLRIRLRRLGGRPFDLTEVPLVR